MEKRLVACGLCFLALQVKLPSFPEDCPQRCEDRKYAFRRQRTVKIADFGVARIEASNPNDMTGETGTLGYMAPEVFFPCSFVSKFEETWDKEVGF